MNEESGGAEGRENAAGSQPDGSGPLVDGPLRAQTIGSGLNKGLGSRTAVSAKVQNHDQFQSRATSPPRIISSCCELIDPKTHVQEEGKDLNIPTSVSLTQVEPKLPPPLETLTSKVSYPPTPRAEGKRKTQPTIL